MTLGIITLSTVLSAFFIFVMLSVLMLKVVMTSVVRVSVVARLRWSHIPQV
jgi:hypothetical protein